MFKHLLFNSDSNEEISGISEGTVRCPHSLTLTGEIKQVNNRLAIINNMNVYSVSQHQVMYRGKPLSDYTMDTPVKKLKVDKAVAAAKKQDFVSGR